MRDLDASPAREVAIRVELFLELERLVARVRLPRSFLFEAELSWNNLNTKETYNFYMYIVTRASGDAMLKFSINSRQGIDNN